MKELKIVRFDGKFYICTDKDNSFFAIEKDEMPAEVKIRDTILINAEGIIQIKQK